jgi:hypothetical protein
MWRAHSSSTKAILELVVLSTFLAQDCATGGLQHGAVLALYHYFQIAGTVPLEAVSFSQEFGGGSDQRSTSWRR